MLEDYYIGQLKPEGADIATTTTASTTSTTVKGGDATTNGVVGAVGKDKLLALDPKKRIAFTLAKRVQLSPDSLLLRFNLQSPQHTLGLPVGE